MRICRAILWSLIAASVITALLWTPRAARATPPSSDIGHGSAAGASGAPGPGESTAATIVDAAAASEGTKGPTFWMPEQASTVAGGVDWVFMFITWLSVFFFVLIVAIMFWFMIKYRRRTPHDKATSTVTHNTPLELTWTVLPLILVIAIFYVGMEGYLNLRRAPAGAYEVMVSAQKWNFNFQHRNGCNEGELWVPVGRPVELIMTSQDVLHALFIPAFRVKQDIIPGRYSTLWFEATKTGEFDLYCAEYCGKDHSLMRAKVIVVDEEAFQRHLDECANWIKDVPDEQLPEAGARLYTRCSSCHSLDGKSGIGPTWRGLWAKLEAGEEVFSDGTTLKDLMGPGKMFESPEDYVLQSMLTPQQKVVMNFPASMPTVKGQLKDREMLALMLFIKHLDEFDEKGKRLPGTEPKPTPAVTTQSAAEESEGESKTQP